MIEWTHPTTPPPATTAQVAFETEYQAILRLQRDLDGRRPCATCGHSILWHGDRAIVHCGGKDKDWVPAGPGYKTTCDCDLYREKY